MALRLPASDPCRTATLLLQAEVGKGAFQEMDQLAAVAPHVKWAGQAASLEDIPATLQRALQVGPS